MLIRAGMILGAHVAAGALIGALAVVAGVGAARAGLAHRDRWESDPPPSPEAHVPSSAAP